MRASLGVLLGLAACAGSGTGGDAGGFDAGRDAGTDGGAVGAVFRPFADETDAQDLVVEASGAVHVAAHVTGTLTNNIVYAYCASNCGVKSSFQTVVLGSVGLSNSELVLRVTADGKPRLLQPGITSGPNGFDYWTCESGCTNAAAWTHTRVRDDAARVTVGFEHEYFAVGPSGQAAFVYLSSAGTNVSTCTGSCGAAANWKTGVLTLNGFADIQLRFDSTGLLHLGAVDVSMPGAAHPVYLQCSSGCDVGTNWTGVTFANSTNAPLISLALTGDVPRMAAWYDDVGNPTLNHRVVVFACDAACTTAAGWRNFFIEWPEKTSARLERRTKLLINGATSVIVARGASTLLQAKCMSNCAMGTGKWTFTALNTATAMNALFPLLQPCERATWFFDDGMTGGLTSTGALVLGYRSHARALSGNDAGVCSAGFDYDFQTVVQVIP